jgi:hypothetical protein
MMQRKGQERKWPWSLQALSQYLPGGTNEDEEKPKRMAGLCVDTRNFDLSNAKWEFCSFDL